MGVGDLAEIVKSALIVLRHAFAGRVHPADFPLRREMPLIGGILQRGEALALSPAVAARCRQRQRKPSLGASDAVLGAGRAVKGAKPARRTTPRPNTLATATNMPAPDNAGDMLRCPHSTLSRLKPPGWVTAPQRAGPTCWAYFHR